MNIWEQILIEVQGASGGFNFAGDGRFGGLPFKPSNFQTTPMRPEANKDPDAQYPYDGSAGGGPVNAADEFTAPSGHQRSRGRPDHAGLPAAPRFQNTWESGPDSMPDSAWKKMEEGWKNWAAGAAMAGSMLGATPAYAEDSQPQQGQEQVQQVKYKNVRPGEAKMYERMGLTQQQIKKELDWMSSESMRRTTADMIVQSAKVPMNDMGDGKSYGQATIRQGKVVKEATGTPISPGGFTPFASFSQRGARDAAPVKDKWGRNITEPQIDDKIDMKFGPANMMANTIPGNHPEPTLGDDGDPEIAKWKPPEENKMNLREFFDPETPPTEEVENPEQTHEKDQTDDEVENNIDRIYGQENNREFEKDDEEQSDDSSDMDVGPAQEDDYTGGGPGEPPGDVDAKGDEAEMAGADAEAEAQGMSDTRAGMITLGGEPAGIIHMGDSPEGGPDNMGRGVGMGEPPTGSGMGPPGGPPKATLDAQDWQLTVEPEAGQMPTLSSMMGAGEPGPPMGNVDAMTQQAQGLLPKKDSSWDTMDIQVGDAMISLKKTGGLQPPMGPPPPPPGGAFGQAAAMIERLKKSKKKK